jgi:indolepyruvate ferredoxin oxidoreductase, beta subunit
MKQQIIVSGLGGQGALTLTRLLAEAAFAAHFPVLTSETHGMAQRGGTVISMIKVGPFRGPLIPAGAADVGLFLTLKNLAVHGFYLKPEAARFVNSGTPGDYWHLDARTMAQQLGAPVAANLILLGYAVGRGALFCDPQLMEEVITAKSLARFRESNLRAFGAGVEAARRANP